MTQTPQEIALEFAKVIGMKNPYIIGIKLVQSRDEEGVFTLLHYNDTDSVLKVAMKWLKNNYEADMQIEIYVNSKYIDCHIRQIGHVNNYITIAQSKSIPQAIMLVVIEADKILKGKV